jgi:hypothetical protein
VTPDVLFIHCGGADAYAEDTALVERLNRELGAMYTLHYPRMPDENQPHYAAWRDLILRKIDALAGLVVLVGHSLGGSVLLKVLAETQPWSRVAGVFAMTVPFWDAPDWEVDDYALPAGFAARFPSDLPLSFYHSHDAAVVPFARLQQFAAQLPQATVRALPAGGHQLGNDLGPMARDIRNLDISQELPVRTGEEIARRSQNKIEYHYSPYAPWFDVVW